MRIFLVVVLCILMLYGAGCQTQSTESSILLRSNQGQISVSEPVIRTDDGSVYFETERVALQVPKPHDWEIFSIEYGVVIAERFASVATGGKLEGMMVSVFVTPLSDFAFDIQMNDTNNTLAADVLRQIVAEPDFIGSAHVTDVMSITWDNHDAAYYLLRDNDLDLLTMVLGIMLPDSDMLLTFTISAPTEQEGRIRDKLPDLLNGLIINQMSLSADVIHTLPDPLDFPVD